MTIKKGDFIEVEYTGKNKDTDTIFDTTDETIAKENNLYNPKTKFGPVVVILGEHHLLVGLDKQLEGKELGEYTFDINPEDGFGKKQADLIKLVPLKAFSKDDVKPFVGLEVGIDDKRGIVRSVSGGRILVDFNHPLSGRELEYKIKVNSVVTDTKRKIEGLFEILKLPFNSIRVDGKNAFVEYKQDIPDEVHKTFAKEIQKFVDVTLEKEAKKSKDNIEIPNATSKVVEAKPTDKLKVTEKPKEDSE